MTIEATNSTASANQNTAACAPSPNSEQHYLVSTANITEETAAWLRSEGVIAAQYNRPGDPMPVLSMGATPYGYFVHAPEAESLAEHKIPSDLRTVLEHVRSAGCAYAYIDQDIEPVPGLPLYEW